VTQGIDTSGKVIFTSHLGNELSTIVPTEVSADELLGESFILLIKETASPEPNLDDLMSRKVSSTKQRPFRIHPMACMSRRCHSVFSWPQCQEYHGNG
jgi:hypothetical protein